MFSSLRSVKVNRNGEVSKFSLRSWSGTLHFKNEEPIGNRATRPGFSGDHFGGKIVDTTVLRGSKIWLSFYCYSTCQSCTSYLNDLVKLESIILDRGIARIAVFRSPPGLITPALCGRGAKPFSVVADPEERLAEVYGVQSKKQKKSWFGFLSKGEPKKTDDGGDASHLPAHFLIDEMGILSVAHYGESDVDHIAWSAVDLFSKKHSTIRKAPAPKAPTVPPPPEEVLDLTKTSAVDRAGLRGGKKGKERTLVEKIEKTATDIWRSFEGQ